ncbi:MAG: glycosyltransferase family protein [Bacteroidota bacterium]
MVSNPIIIIQARMNSERLPGKILKPIGGKPMIGILIERLRQSGIPMMLATSTNKENDELVDFAQKSGIDVFRGNEDNVLERYYLAALACNADPIIRLTGDNPLMDGSLVKDVLAYYQKFKNSRVYVSTGLSKTFPLGISAEVFSFELLKEANLNANLPGEFEHVTPYMHQNRPGDVKIFPYAGEMNKYHYRLTVDTEKDFKLVKALVEDYKCDQQSVIEIVGILDSHPELARMNNSIIQKSWI